MAFSKYYKNFILCGDVDRHCLLCNETFQTIEDIEKHIRWEKHRQNIKTHTCLTKFKSDEIYKIESNYYCQYCNHVFQNIAAIKAHIVTNEHISNKSSTEAKIKKIEVVYDAGVIKINDIKIDILQWHGIQNKKCLLCNVVVENVNKHIEIQDHIVRLIQTKLKYDGQDKYYRKINDNTFQCFTCNITFDDFDKHWTGNKHTKVTEPQAINGEAEKPIRIYDRAQYYKLTERKYDLDKLISIEDDFYKVDMVKKEIICISCKTAVKNTERDLCNHMYKKHENYNTEKSKIITQIRDEMAKEYIYIFEIDHGKARHELAKYGKDNHIKMNAGGSKGYCMLCDRYLSAHINIFKQHVGGSVHSGHLELNGEIKAKKHKRGPTKPDTLSRFLSRIEYMPELDAIVINMTFCIDKYSFLLLKQIDHGQHFKKTKCFICDEIFEKSQEKDHCESKTHKANVMTVKVIMNKNNFIREIRPKLYHCGLCNVTLPFWEKLEKHIVDLSHLMKTQQKSVIYAFTEFKEDNGRLPIEKKIEYSTNNEVLYENLLKVLFYKKFCDIKFIA